MSYAFVLIFVSFQIMIKLLERVEFGRVCKIALMAFYCHSLWFLYSFGKLKCGFETLYTSLSQSFHDEKPVFGLLKTNCRDFAIKSSLIFVFFPLLHIKTLPKLPNWCSHSMAGISNLT